MWLFERGSKLFLAFFQIGIAAFGGGYVAIPFIEDVVVVRHGWLNLAEMGQVIGLSQITPGPIAINAATFVGYRIGGIGGSVAATLGVVLPSVLAIFSVAFILGLYERKKGPSSKGRLQQFRAGLRPAICALMTVSLFSVGKGSICDWKALALAVGTFAALSLGKGKWNPAWVVLSAGIIGLGLHLL